MEMELQALGMSVDVLDDIAADDRSADSANFAVLRPAERILVPADIARQRGLDLVITAYCSCSPQPMDEKMKDLKKYESRITNCVAWDPRADETLAIVKADAVSYKFDEEKAIQNSAEEAAGKAVQALVRELTERETLVTAVIFILGIEDQNQADHLVKYLQDRPGIREVNVVKADFGKRSVRLEAKLIPEARPKLGDLLIKAPDVKLETIESAGGYYLMRVVE
jgi:hypothetical protein